jgi:hypothetical protein
MAPVRPTTDPLAASALALLVLLALAACKSTGTVVVQHPLAGCAPTGASVASPPHGLAWPAFHGDRARTGWNAQEPALTPAAVAAHGMALAWESPELDGAMLDATVYTPHAYASPLYADDVPMGPCGGAPLSVVFAATSNGYVCAVNAFAATVYGGAIAPGTVLWSTSLGSPLVIPKLDGGVPLGVLATPFLDMQSTPPRLYVVAADASAGWRAWALDATTGAVLPGWPVTIDDAATRAINTNGPSLFQDPTVLSQRGALDLSADGSLLFVPFGGYFDGSVGWMVAIDTVGPGLAAATSIAPSAAPVANGGIWSPGGSAIDADGFVYAETGNSPVGSANGPNVWGESLLQWRAPLALAQTYTPFNYCALDAADTDLGGAGPVVLPDLDPSTTSTPKLLAMGSKQGNVYLVDRTHLGGTLAARPPCSKDSTTDLSLLPPGPQPQFGLRGPLNVFGPYSEGYGNADHAKMRTTPAFFAAAGTSYLYATGATKAQVDATSSVPPSVVRLRVVTAPGAPAYLAIDGADASLAFVNPGSPVVTSQGDGGPIVWVVDENASRAASLLSATTPLPVLYAVDGTSLVPLWNSTSGGAGLRLGGKYETPVVAHGTVFVVTDRVQAFVLGP